VGAQRFDLTFTDATGEKIGYRGNRPLEQLRPAMSAILREAAERQHNVIVRPRSSDATLIQLDDLGEDTAARLMQESAKAQENGEAYVLRTARNAAAALKKRSRLQR
jgi:hypothetical protein